MIELDVTKVAQLPPARPEVILTSASELTRWASSIRVKRAQIRLRLSLPALSQQEHLYWQQQIERLYNDCGCSAATVSLLGVIVVIIAYAALIGFEQPIWLVVLGTVVATGVALFVGKIIGHAWSRRELRRQVAQLIRFVERRSKYESSP
jgi:hypothetical protein